MHLWACFSVLDKKINYLVHAFHRGRVYLIQERKQFPIKEKVW